MNTKLTLNSELNNEPPNEEPVKGQRWHNIIVWLAVGLIALQTFATDTKGVFEYNPVMTTYFTSSGIIKKPTKVWTGIVTPTTANGFSVDISSAGFTNIRSYQVICVRNTTDPMLVPNVSIKTITNTDLVMNITQGNAATVAILGVNVLSGSPVVFATSPTTMQLSIIVTGD